MIELAWGSDFLPALFYFSVLLFSYSTFSQSDLKDDTFLIVQFLNVILLLNSVQ